MAEISTRELDIIVFGATGFTGRHTVPYVHKFCKENGRRLTWGIAGRSEIQLRRLIVKLEKDLGIPANEIPFFIANADDDDSLCAMVRRCRLIINCCGPFRFYGEAVVEACLQEGTHHIDVSGEPQYMELVQLKYHKEAEEKGLYIVSACGWDSIPTDMGVVFLQQHFDGTLNSVETYIEGYKEDDGDCGGKSVGSYINFGTWESAIYSIAYADELRELRTQLFSTPLPTFQPKLKAKKYPHKTDLTAGWVVPFLGSDRSVVRRSQRFFYENEKQRPIQVETYLVIKSFFTMVILAFYGLMFSIFARFERGRLWMLKYPEYFTAGMINTHQPTEENIEKSWFSIQLYGVGWKEKLSEPTDTYTAPVDTAILGRVKGNNPGYGTTCIALTLAGIVLLTEMEKLPGKGGVYTPGAAFAKTTLIEQLNDNGVTFEILSEKDLSKK